MLWWPAGRGRRLDIGAPEPETSLVQGPRDLGLSLRARTPDSIVDRVPPRRVACRPEGRRKPWNRSTIGSQGWTCIATASRCASGCPAAWWSGHREAAVRDDDRALARLRAWLADRQVTLVGMEATGVYWKPVYYALGGPLRGVAVQRPPRQERARPQDRHVRRRVAGRRCRAWHGPPQFRAAAADPPAARPDPLPQEADRCAGRRDPATGEGASGRRDQADLGGFQGADPVGPADDRGAHRRPARPGRGWPSWPRERCARRSRP